MSEREADEKAQHGEVLRWSPTVHYVTTVLTLIYFLFKRPFITFCLSILGQDDDSKCPKSDEGKGQDVDETKSEDVQEDNTTTQAQTSDDEQDNIPIAASIRGASKSKRPLPSNQQSFSSVNTT